MAGTASLDIGDDNITTDFTFETGQKGKHYGYSSIIRKPDQAYFQKLKFTMLENLWYLILEYNILVL